MKVRKGNYAHYSRCEYRKAPYMRDFQHCLKYNMLECHILGVRKLGEDTQMRGYQHMVGSRHLKKKDIPKTLSFLQVKLLKFPPLLSSAILLHTCHSSLLRWLLLQ